MILRKISTDWKIRKTNSKISHSVVASANFFDSKEFKFVVTKVYKNGYNNKPLQWFGSENLSFHRRNGINSTKTKTIFLNFPQNQLSFKSYEYLHVFCSFFFKFMCVFSKLEYQLHVFALNPKYLTMASHQKRFLSHAIPNLIEWNHVCASTLRTCLFCNGNLQLFDDDNGDDDTEKSEQILVLLPFDMPYK